MIWGNWPKLFQQLSSTGLPLTVATPGDLLDDHVSKRSLVLDNSSEGSGNLCEHVLDSFNLL